VQQTVGGAGMSEEVATPSFCAQCRSRCGCNAITRDGKLLRIEPLPGHPTGAKLCPKGLATPELIYHPDRLTRPMRRTTPKGKGPTVWEPISWNEALAEIARWMGEIRDRHGAEQVAFSVTTPSGTQISDAISWIERFIRCFGSPNTIYATEICNWHKDYASRLTYGTDIGTPDFSNSQCVLLWGNNPAATWLARSTEIQKAIKRGAKLIVVDPRPTMFARRADCWLRVKPGTDQALALGLAHLMIRTGRFDQDFIRRWSNGPFLVRADTGAFLREADVSPGGSKAILLAANADRDDLLRFDLEKGLWLDDPGTADLFAERDLNGAAGRIRVRSAFRIFADAAAHMSPDKVETITGVASETLHEAVGLLGMNAPVAYYAWNGVGQSLTATQTDRAISLLYALTGSYGGKGGNVPGGAAAFADISGHEFVTPEQRAKTLGLAERPLGPGLNGWVTAGDVYRAVTDHAPYPVRMLLSFGTNLIASQPDGAHARGALEQLEFHVHADFFINATADYADIVLPVATSWEREGLRTGFDVSLDGLRRVQLRSAAIDPVGEARSDTDIVLDLAARLGMSAQFFAGDADRGHDHVLAPAGLTVAELRAQPEGVTIKTTVQLLRHVTCDADGRPLGFPTPTRRVEIYSERLLEHGYDPVPSLQDRPISSIGATFPLRLSCAKTVAFCHSQHRNLASLRRLMPDPILEMAAEAAAARGIANNDWVKVSTAVGSFVARCKVVKDLQADSVFAQHGWWVDGPEGTPYDAQTPWTANVNTAIHATQRDPISGSLPLRCFACEVTAIG
jgi:anaerobic selenocysteine-containing dehydrogenase